MALTPAEKQRAYRERRKGAMRDAAKSGRDDVAALINTSFSDYWTGGAEDAEINLIRETLGSIGLYLDFAEDADPECDAGLAGSAESRGSLGRAERAVGALLDCATALAGIVNRFKLAEIDRALTEIAQTDLSDPGERARALKEVVALEKLKALLAKEVRRSLPATVVLNGDTATV